MNIRIFNLGSRITNDSLDALFSTYGTVSALQLLPAAPNSAAKGAALLNMPNEAEAATAILKINGSIIGGCAIGVAKTAHQPL